MESAGALLFRQHLIHLPNAVGQQFHHMHRKKWILRNEISETPVVNFRQDGSFAGNDRGCARGMIEQRHLAKNRAARGMFYDFITNVDRQRAFEQNEHAITRFAGLEKRFAGRQPHRVFFMTK